VVNHHVNLILILDSNIKDLDNALALKHSLHHYSIQQRHHRLFNPESSFYRRPHHQYPTTANFIAPSTQLQVTTTMRSKKSPLPYPSDPFTSDPDLPSYEESIAPRASISPLTHNRPHNQNNNTDIDDVISHLSDSFQQRTQLRSPREDQVLTALKSHIHSFLDSSPGNANHHSKARLIMVPDKAINQSAVPCSFDYKDPNERAEVVRIGIKGADFDDKFFWDNEAMARRLVGFFEGQDNRIPLSTSKTSGLRWLVECEEMTFRSVNDFGLWGTERGWVVVFILG